MCLWVIPLVSTGISVGVPLRNTCLSMGVTFRDLSHSSEPTDVSLFAELDQLHYVKDGHEGEKVGSCT
jgi:hypothetical protein